MQSLKFKDNSYPLRNITMPSGDRTISTLELNDALMNEDGSYSSTKAQIIDEQIFYFVEKEYLHSPEKELVRKIIFEI